jgi:hypothetical protein
MEDVDSDEEDEDDSDEEDDEETPVKKVPTHVMVKFLFHL